MTDKEKIKQEIEKLIERAQAERVLYPKTILAAKNFLLIEDYNRLLGFIDSLPEEPASEDLEEELDNFLKDPVFGKLINRNAGLVLARHFAEWQRERILQKDVVR